MQVEMVFRTEDNREVFGFGLQTESKLVDDAENVFEVMITTENTDRDGDIVVASGGQLDPYRANPVVLFGHSYRDIAVARTIELDILPSRGIKTLFQFPPFGTSVRADEIHGLWRAKFLNAASIGFMPLKWENLEVDHDTWFPPRKFTEWELFEWSIVTVPANREALRLAVKGLGLDWDVLDELERERKQKDVAFWNAVGEYVSTAKLFMQQIHAVGGRNE